MSRKDREHLEWCLKKLEQQQAGSKPPLLYPRAKPLLKGKLDEYGCLYIERAGRMELQRCRPGGIAVHDGPSGNFMPCQDDCPKLDEPEKLAHIDFDDGSTYGFWRLEICGRVLEFFEFKDERKKKQDEC